jgi:outer membrane immunogenic protein
LNSEPAVNQFFANEGSKLMKNLIVASLAVAGLSAGFSLPAAAADLSQAYKAPAPLPPFTWTGVYFGGNAGYGFQTSSDAVVLSDPSATAPGLKETGGFVGIQMGYNYQMGMLVLGLEGDVQAANIKDSYNRVIDAAGDSLNASGNADEFGTIRARIGGAFDHFLVYATGGAALGGISNTLDVTTSSGGFTMLQNDSTRLGYTVGAGLEYAVDRNWSIKGEYQYISFGSESLSPAGTINTISTTSNSVTTDIQTVRIGVNWHFHQ